MIKKEKLIKRFNKIHKNKYDYSLLPENFNYEEKIPIKCYDHGIFNQLIVNHLAGSGCPICNSVKLTKDEYFDKCRKIHNNFYDYSISEFVGVAKKIKIICPEHGIFEQRASNHIMGQKCIYCANKRWNTNKFIKLAKEVHGDKFDYSLCDYKNAHTKIKIICSIHGIFEQIPWNHIKELAGCPYCSENKTTLEIFKYKSNWKHNNRYDYSLITEYINNTTKVKIICPQHGIFEQNPRNHQWGDGCPKCTESKGERIIREFLEKHNIVYLKEYSFDGCKYKQLLRFDFYLPEQNSCIEYDGQQHFESIDWFGGKESLMECQKRDEIKTKYCKVNNINLIRIKYYENIEEKLKLSLKKIISNWQ